MARAGPTLWGLLLVIPYSDRLELGVADAHCELCYRLKVMEDGTSQSTWKKPGIVVLPG
ncbi:MAG: hypothetical protein JRJ17_06005 [Deltaproteobacteria bacterium]|nr:hypothetical protein [Deltaproteobacteria bacterium]